jgi:hypothetical protein
VIATYKQLVLEGHNEKLAKLVEQFAATHPDIGILLWDIFSNLECLNCHALYWGFSNVVWDACYPTLGPCPVLKYLLPSVGMTVILRLILTVSF